MSSQKYTIWFNDGGDMSSNLLAIKNAVIPSSYNLDQIIIFLSKNLSKMLIVKNIVFGDNYNFV